MILQRLSEYYDRLIEDPSVEIPPFGFINQSVQFCMVLDRRGNLQQVNDLRRQEGRRKVAPSMTVPHIPGRTGSSVIPFFLWDNTGYVLGRDDKGKPERAARKFREFCKLHRELIAGSEDEDLQAVIKFLDSWKPENCEGLDDWEEMAGQNLVFRIEGQKEYLHQKPSARSIWCNHLAGGSGEERGLCLVSGSESTLARLHPSIKGVRDAQSTGAAIVSFNQDSFTSYGKSQSYNAPVSEERAFAYVTALNRLLSYESRQKIQLGDSTTVFWTDRPSPAEDMLSMIFEPESIERQAEDESLRLKLREILDALREGKMPPELGDPETGFYILGLAPNAARISVRFWQASTLEDVAGRIGQHFRDMSIRKNYDGDPEYLSLWRILQEPFTRRPKKGRPDLMSEYPSVLASSLTRAVLTGAPYPNALLALTLARIRADGAINYTRASMIKAFIVRSRRIKSKPEEAGMTLNPDSPDIGYQLGRLFAALEKAQKDAVPGAQATIKDRYFAAASATPRAVFPHLMKLSQHHLHKAEYGGITDRQIEQILEKIDAFPAHLSLESQGMFTLGYYHQRPELYKKSEKQEENDNE